MIQVAAFRRDMAREGERIAVAAAAAGNGRVGADLSRLVDALARQSQVYAALTSVDDGHTLDLAPVSPVITVNTDTPAGRAEREDQILADLLRHPEQARDLARLVPVETFTSGQRREIYETMISLAEAGDPIDEIIVAWELERLRATATLFGQRSAEPEQLPEPDVVFLARLAVTTVAAGTAITIGHQLVSEDVRVGLAASTAVAQVRQAGHGVPDRPAVDPTLIPPATPNNGQQPTIEL
jgi:hypothetical protein